MGGGSAANTACWLASLGTPVRLVGGGGRRRARPRRAGRARGGSASPSRGRSTRRLPTGQLRRAHRRDGERTMLPDRGANEDALAGRGRGSPALTATSTGCTSRATRCLGAGSHPAAQARAGGRSSGSACPGRSTPRAPPRCGGCGPTPVPRAGSRAAPCCSPTTTSSRALGGVAGRARQCAGEVVVKLGPAGASWTDGARSESSPAAQRHRRRHRRRRRRLRRRLPRRSARRRRRRPRRSTPGAVAAARAVSQRGARP